jgi:hypothetical protein
MAPGSPVPEAILRDPNVDGIALCFLWSRIEPREGEFNWAIIDREVEKIRASGKYYSMVVTPGISTPPWVYAAGSRAFEFRWDKPWGPPPCTLVRFPIPWDQAYLKKWHAFVRALGARYSADPHLVLAKIQGVNAQTPEFLLPHDRPGAHSGERLVGCEPSDEIAEWQRMDYRPSKVRHAWEASAEAYRSAFPNQELALETGPWGMPPIDNSGNLIRGQATDLKLPDSIISTGKELLPHRFVAQNDGLQATWAWPALRELARPEPFAFQMAWKVTDDPSCRMNRFIRPCDPREMLQKSTDRGINAGAAYLEIYQADLVNPSLNDIVAQTHRRLLDQVSEQH